MNTPNFPKQLGGDDDRLSGNRDSTAEGRRNAEQWLSDNRESIDVLNKWVEENGSFSQYQCPFSA